MRSYLTTLHRDRPDRGCSVAALGSEIARHPRKTREAFTEGLDKTLGIIASALPDTVTKAAQGEGLRDLRDHDRLAAAGARGVRRRDVAVGDRCRHRRRAADRTRCVELTARSLTPEQTMITAVSHLAFAADDVEAAAADYEIVLDRKPPGCSRPTASRSFAFSSSNIAFEISAADGRGEGLKSIGFEAVDIDATVRKLGRRGLGVGAIVEQRSRATAVAE